jgi:flagellar biosynthesis/type III secretory pathway protein FliH
MKSEKPLGKNETIVEKDHKAMIEDGVFAFCPYCAYPLKEPKRYVNFEYEQGKRDGKLEGYNEAYCGFNNIKSSKAYKNWLKMRFEELSK